MWVHIQQRWSVTRDRWERGDDRRPAGARAIYKNTTLQIGLHFQT